MPLKMILAAVVVAAAALAVWFFGIRDDDDSSAADGDTSEETVPTAPTVTTLPLDDSGTELQDLLASSRDGTFHATYEATRPSQTEGGEAEHYTLEIWRDGGRTRQDTITELEGGDYLTAGIQADGVTVICAKQGAADWVCSQTESGDDAISDGIFGTLLADLGGVEVTATDETIDGEAARCFSYESPEGPGSMCLNADGVPLRITGGADELVLTELEDTVDESVFEPPAEPAQAEAPSS